MEDKRENGTPAAQANPGFEDRTCKEASLMTFWGGNLFIISIIIAVLFLIFAGFVTEGANTVFKFDLMASGITTALLMVVAGYAAKILLQAFAIVVEAHYRQLAPAVSTPVESPAAAETEKGEATDKPETPEA